MAEALARNRDTDPTRPGPCLRTGLEHRSGRSGRGNVIDDLPRRIQIVDHGTDDLDLLLHLVENHELGFHGGAELGVNTAGNGKRETRLCDGRGTRPMGRVPFRRKSHRHDHHETPAGRQALRRTDQMLGRNVFVARPIDRGGEGRVHDNDTRKVGYRQKIVDMFGVDAGHRAPEHHLEQRAPEGIDLVEQRLAAGADGKAGQRAGPGRRFEDGFGGTDGGGTGDQGGVGQRGAELLQADLLLGAPGFGQEP